MGQLPLLQKHYRLENGSSATYSSGADEDVASTGVVLLPGDTLTDLSRATGPNGSPLDFC